MVWYEKTDSDTLWSPFKQYFTQAYTSLLKICGS